MNSLFEKGGRKVFISAYTVPDLPIGNNIGKIDKKPVPSIYTTVKKWNLCWKVKVTLYWR